MNGINEEKVLEILAKEAKSMSESENIEIEKRLLEVPEDLDKASKMEKVLKSCGNRTYLYHKYQCDRYKYVRSVQKQALQSVLQ